MDDIEKLKIRVAKAALVNNFQESEFGLTVIGWLNQEVSRLTNQLADDDELDSDNVKRASVRGELKAYRLIGKQMNFVKIRAVGAEQTLQDNGIATDADTRSFEQIAEDAGL